MKTAEAFLNELKKTPQVPFSIDQLLPDSRQAFMIICGQPEIGKTNLSLHLAFCLAKGEPFFHYKTQKKKVGYLAMEGGQQQIGTRIEILSQHFQGIPDNFFIQVVPPLPLTEKGKTELMSLVTGLEVVIIDPLKFLIPGDYMKPSDVMKALTAVIQIQNETSTTFILVGHIRKPDRKQISYPEDYWTELKGPTEYMEMTNSALMLTRPAHSQDSRGYFTSSPNDRILYFIKTRDATKELKPLKLKFNREKLLYLPIEERCEEGYS
ncbi:AAA family ATPase, partial [Chloroflexota bacterium]